MRVRLQQMVKVMQLYTAVLWCPLLAFFNITSFTADKYNGLQMTHFDTNLNIEAMIPDSSVVIFVINDYQLI